ncbi:MAG: phage virion morphogenesis protein [Gammaproteobacteria bacterium]|nr:MAG: phage virion morphogenesis protein [Gammaproteobacteria bacterium]
MAGASLRIDIRYDNLRIRALLRRLQEAGGDLEDAFAEIGELLLRTHRRRFEEQKDPEGNAWLPLKESTLRRKKKNADKVLIESGNLMETLRYRVGADRLEFGTDRIYGATHQFGDDSRNIPARPFLGISPEDEADIEAIITEHIERAFR